MFVSVVKAMTAPARGTKTPAEGVKIFRRGERCQQPDVTPPPGKAV